MVKNASPAARSLARKGVVALKPETVAVKAAHPRAPHALNPAQQAAFQQIRDGIEARALPDFSAARRHRLGQDRGLSECHRDRARRWPQRAAAGARDRAHARRWPASSSRASAIASPSCTAPSPTSERTEQWRRIRSGAAGVVVGTRSGVFAPVRNLGLIVVDEEHDGSYKQEETPRYNGRDVAIVRAQARRRLRGAGLRHAQPGEPLQRRARQVHAAGTARPHRGAAHAAGGADRHAAGVSGDAQAGHLLAPLIEAVGGAPGERRADHRAAQPPRLFQLRRLPRLRRARAVRQLLA